METGLQHYLVTITGAQPLLMHADDIEWADRMEAWKNDKSNVKNSKAGDDRSPAWRWLGNLYHDGIRIAMPVENLMRCLMEGAAMVPVPGGKNGKTFKAQSQSGIQPLAATWPLLVNGKEILIGNLLKMAGNPKFDDHKNIAIEHGFELFVKRAKIGQSKHVRVRPQFQTWATSGELVVSDDQITESILADILQMAGKYKGLGDWRPSSKTPGFRGMFTAEVKLMKGKRN